MSVMATVLVDTALLGRQSNLGLCKLLGLELTLPRLHLVLLNASSSVRLGIVHGPHDPLMFALPSNVEDTLAYLVVCVKVLGRACTLLDQIQYFCPKLLEFLYKVNTTSNKAEEGKVSMSNYLAILIHRVHRTVMPETYQHPCP